MMRRFIFLGVLSACLLVIAGAVLAKNEKSLSAAPSTTTLSSGEQTTMVSVAPSTTASALTPESLLEPKEDPRLEPLTSYFETAMNTWAKPDKLSADYHSIATDVATVVLAEDPIWDSDTNRYRTGLVLLGIGFWESRYRTYVDDGSCNKWVNGVGAPKEIAQLIQGGNCDGGWAHSIFQIHPMKWFDGKKFTEYTGKMLLADRKTAVKAALLIARRSIRNGAGLCWYTGEGADGGGCPKGVTRLNTGVDYAKKHPFSITTE